MSADAVQWPRYPIGRIAVPRLGGNYRNSESVTTRPLIKMGNIARVRIDLSRLAYIHGSESVDPIHLLHAGDVLLNTRNTLDLVGKVSMWRDELPLAYYNSNILRLEFKPEFCGDSRYFGYALNSAESIHAIRNLATGTTSVAAVYTRDLLKLQVPVPGKEEQRAIAATLDDAHQLIENLLRMIAKKQAIKQGMMQQLLTGRARLPGFNGRWVSRKIEEFTQVRSGGTPSRAVPRYWGGDIRWMSSGEIHAKRVSEVAGRITADGLRESAAQLLPSGSVLMALAGQGKTRGTVAISRVALSTNQSIAGILPGIEHDSDFLYYNLDTRYDELRGESSGDGGRGGLNLTIIKNLDVFMPGRDEQAAIATVLADVDDEIDLLTLRLKKAQETKQGMMQELLMGRTRLPVKEAVV